jgi:hypothetical protein
MRIRTWGSFGWLPIALTRAAAGTLAMAAALGSVSPLAFAQAGHDVVLHINPRWTECSFQLDPSLTQAAWRQFTGEAGVVTYFRPLVGAEPMGKGRFEVAVVQWKSGIHDTDAAWNDTFVHPDSAHWLFEGNGLAFPGLTARAGITTRADLGIYVTKSIGANYGFYGAQVQQSLIDDRARNWSAAARGSFVSMYGPKDLDFAVYAVDLVASRRYDLFSSRASVAPYAGVAGSLSRSHEKSSVVNLEDESVWGAHATIGAVARLSITRVAVEYAFATVPSFSLKVGAGR